MLQEFVKSFPLLSIMLFSFLITLVFTIVYKKFTNQAKMKELKDKQKELQERSKQFKDNPSKMLELQQEMMSLSTEQMRASLKITVITLLPFVLFFNFLKDIYTSAGIGNIIYWHTNVPVFGDGAGWFLSYIIFSTIFSILLRKMLKVY